eukprot:148717_1
MSIIIYDIPFTLPHIYNPFNNSDYSNPDSSRILSPKPTPVSAPIEPSSPSVHAPDVLPQIEFDINAYFDPPYCNQSNLMIPKIQTPADTGADIQTINTTIAINQSSVRNRT